MGLQLYGFVQASPQKKLQLGHMPLKLSGWVELGPTFSQNCVFIVDQVTHSKLVHKHNYDLSIKLLSSEDSNTYVHVYGWLIGLYLAVSPESEAKKADFTKYILITFC